MSINQEQGKMFWLKIIMLLQIKSHNRVQHHQVSLHLQWIQERAQEEVWWALREQVYSLRGQPLEMLLQLPTILEWQVKTGHVNHKKEDLHHHTHNNMEAAWTAHLEVTALKMQKEEQCVEWSHLKMRIQEQAKLACQGFHRYKIKRDKALKSRIRKCLYLKRQVKRGI